MDRFESLEHIPSSSLIVAAACGLASLAAHTSVSPQALSYSWYTSWYMQTIAVKLTWMNFRLCHGRDSTVPLSLLIPFPGHKGNQKSVLKLYHQEPEGRFVLAKGLGPPAQHNSRRLGVNSTPADTSRHSHPTPIVS
jgi:hypothetical protein